MKKVGIAVTDPLDWTGNALFNSVSNCGMQPIRFSFANATSEISTGKIHACCIDLFELDAVVVRDLGPAMHNDVQFRYDLICQLEELGVPIINPPESIARAANKYQSSYLFMKNDIMTPETVVTNSLEEAANALSSYGNAVLKPVFGSKGIGIECVRYDDEGLLNLERFLEKNGLIYIQKFIHNPGRDIRIFVVNNDVVGSIYRIAPAGGWINNLSQGGSAEPCVLTQQQHRLGLQAAKAVGTVYAGVDIIEGERDYVIEINGTPSGKGIYEASGIDVTIRIVEYLKNLLG
ncbi:MAG: RimK family alpha-L-glutamate ligase [Candidatus Methanoperedens sp.]|nr:RimK family alpha-L-glutamate ligase [Candidatus Methanoperedens sp.]